jgi:hypothetical protein
MKCQAQTSPPAVPDAPEADELVEVDAARARLALMPLADYVCTLRKARNAVK